MKKLIGAALLAAFLAPLPAQAETIDPLSLSRTIDPPQPSNPNIF